MDMVVPKLSQRSRSSTGNSEEIKLLVDEEQPSSTTGQPSETPSKPPGSGEGSTPLAENLQAKDFVFIKIVARIVLQLLRKFWALSSAALLAIVLFYWLCGGIIAFGFVLFSLSGLLYHATDRFIYHPDQPDTARVFVPSPSSLGLQFESLYIRSRDHTRLHVFFVKHPDPATASGAPTILFLHGNAGNIGHRLFNMKELVGRIGCNVCLLEYRGYGHSDGTPSEEGLYLDAQAALDHLRGRQDVDTAKIVVFGRSLGGAVAIDLSSRAENREKVACLLVENSFTSIPDIAKVLLNFRLVRIIPKCFYKNRFDAVSKARRLTMPTLFLSGLADTLVPPPMMSDLFNACAAESKHLGRFPRGTHNETWTCPQYFHTILYFFEEIVQMGGPSRNRLPPPPTLQSDSQNVV